MTAKSTRIDLRAIYRDPSTMDAGVLHLQLDLTSQPSQVIEDHFGLDHNNQPFIRRPLFRYHI